MANRGAISRTNEELRALNSESYSDRPQQSASFGQRLLSYDTQDSATVGTNPSRAAPGEYVRSLPSTNYDIDVPTDEETLESRYTLQTYTAGDEEETHVTYDTLGDDTAMSPRGTATVDEDEVRFAHGASASFIVTNAEDLLREKRLCLASSSFFFVGTLLSFSYFWLKNTNGLPLLPELVLDLLLCLAHTIMAGHVLFFEFAALDGGFNCCKDKKWETRRALDHMRYAQTVSGKRPFSREIRLVNMTQSLLFLVATIMQAIALISVNGYYHQAQEMLQENGGDEAGYTNNDDATEFMDDEQRARLMKQYNGLTFVSSLFYFFSASTIVVVHAIRMLFERLRRSSKAGSPSRQLLQNAGKQPLKLRSTNTPLPPDVLDDIAEKRYMSILTLDHIANTLYMLVTTAMLVVSIYEFSVEDPDVRILGDVNLLEILAFLWVWIGALYLVADFLRWSYVHPTATLSRPIAIDSEQQQQKNHGVGGPETFRRSHRGLNNSRTSRKGKEGNAPLNGAKKSVHFPTTPEYVPAIEVELDASCFPIVRRNRPEHNKETMQRIKRNFSKMFTKEKEKPDIANAENDDDDDSYQLIEMINCNMMNRYNAPIHPTEYREKTKPENCFHDKKNEERVDPPTTELKVTDTADVALSSPSSTQLPFNNATEEEREYPVSVLGVTSSEAAVASMSQSGSYDHSSNIHQRHTQPGDGYVQDEREPNETTSTAQAEDIKEEGDECHVNQDEKEVRHPPYPARISPLSPPSRTADGSIGDRTQGKNDGTSLDYIAVECSERCTTPECPLERSGASSANDPPILSASRRSSASFATVARRLEARVQAVANRKDDDNDFDIHARAYSNYSRMERHHAHLQQRQRQAQQHMERFVTDHKPSKVSQISMDEVSIIRLDGSDVDNVEVQRNESNNESNNEVETFNNVTATPAATPSRNGKLPLASPRHEHAYLEASSNTSPSISTDGEQAIDLTTTNHSDPSSTSDNVGNSTEEVAAAANRGTGKLPLASPHQPQTPPPIQEPGFQGQEPIDLTDASTEGRDDGLAYDDNTDTRRQASPSNHPFSLSSSSSQEARQVDRGKKYVKYHNEEKKRESPPERGRFDDLEKFIDRF